MDNVEKMKKKFEDMKFPEVDIAKGTAIDVSDKDLKDKSFIINANIKPEVVKFTKMTKEQQRKILDEHLNSDVKVVSHPKKCSIEESREVVLKWFEAQEAKAEQEKLAAKKEETFKSMNRMLILYQNVGNMPSCDVDKHLQETREKYKFVLPESCEFIIMPMREGPTKFEYIDMR